MHWSGVRERIEVLRRDPSSTSVFGAQGHQFALEPALSAADLADLEGWLGVRLPEDYRTFLTEVGAGGAGPAYGLFPVRRDGQGGWQWIEFGGVSLTNRDLVGRPFPSDRATLDVLNARMGQRPTPEDFDDQLDFECAHERWFLELWSDARTAGAICIATKGCALRWWLVVTGTPRGTMWFDPRAEGRDLYGAAGATLGQPLTFGAWYLNWLNRVEQKVDHLSAAARQE